VSQSSNQYTVLLLFFAVAASCPINGLIDRKDAFEIQNIEA